MQHPLQITLRDIGNSESVEALIKEKVAKLEHIHKDILSCRVSAEVKGRHKIDRKSTRLNSSHT